MCGIVGLHGRQEDAWIGAMSALVVHRGPDGAGVFRDRAAELSLAMRRLAIIDLEGGQQPMTTTDGRYTVVFNGEIFNAPELRSELERAGYRFQSDHSDTEVLLHLYAHRGEQMLDALNGMFAFALYDREARTLFCARDRFGIKPLYYVQRDGQFAFASELKSLLTLPFVRRELNREALRHFLSLQFVPGPESIITGVKRLPAGHSLRYRLSERSVRVERWWRPVFGQGGHRPAAEWQDRIGIALRSAVQRWTLSDVPLACSLSGGLDSASIVGILASNARRVSTFSLGFAGEQETNWNELPLARQVAERWGTNHHELVLNPETLLDDLLPMVWHLDEPYGGGLPSWSVFKFMGSEVKVGLTGTGGDELFGGYGKWRELEGGWLSTVWRPRMTLQRFSSHFFDRYYWGDGEKAHFLVEPVDGTAPLSGSSTAELLYRQFCEPASAAIRDRTTATDLATQLPEEFLLMTDRFSMAHSLEARTPFLDHEFAELVLSIPARDRTHRRDLKGMLREAMRDLLPAPLLRAPKKGFVIPLTLWLRGTLRPLVERLLAPERLHAQGLLRPEFHQAYVIPHLAGRADYTNRIWPAVMFQLWHELFIERSSVQAPSADRKALVP